MTSNGNTAKWISIIAAIILTLGFGTVGIIMGDYATRQTYVENDIKRMDKSQTLLIYQLKEINKKLDRLLDN